MNTIAVIEKNPQIEEAKYEGGSLFYYDSLNCKRIVMLCQTEPFFYKLINLIDGNRISSLRLENSKIAGFTGFTLEQLLNKFNGIKLTPISKGITIIPKET